MYAELANTLVPLIVAVTVHSTMRRFLFGLSTTLLISVFVVATQSRAGIAVFILSILAVTALTMLSKPFREYRIRVCVVGVSIIATGAASMAIIFFGGGAIPIVERINAPATVQSTGLRSLLLSVSLEMARSNPFTGVGADNFGQEFSKYRGQYAERATDNNLLSLGEDVMPERSHNEFAQILAELGGLGFGIFFIFLAGATFFFFRAVTRPKDISYYGISAFIGAALFLLSSAVTSYSFRLAQNGIVFFLVLAVGVSVVSQHKETIVPANLSYRNRAAFASAVIVSILACVAMIVYCVTRVAAVRYVLNAAAATSQADSAPLYSRAMWLDPENGTIQEFYGRTILFENRGAESIPYLKNAIALGRATAVDYSYLVTAQLLSGKPADAEKTLMEAIKIYPKSVFLRVRFAAVLNDLGEGAKANDEIALAKSINPEQTEVWQTFIVSGPRAASRKAFEQNLPTVMELSPAWGINAIQADRDLRFPNERFVIPRD